MSEEVITIEFIRILKLIGWDIISFDFPQSGTGLELRPNNSIEKNLGMIKPDIIAQKDGIVLITENKVNYYKKDIDKLNNLRETDDYSNDLRNIIPSYNTSKIYYGVILKLTNNNKLKLDKIKDKIDFSIFYDDKIKKFKINYIESKMLDSDIVLKNQLLSNEKIQIY